MSSPSASSTCVERDASQTQVFPSSASAAAGTYKDKLFLWVDRLSIFAWWPDTAAGLADAKRTMIQQWRSCRIDYVQVPLDELESEVKIVKAQFYIRRIKEGNAGPDEVVCRLEEAMAEMRSTHSLSVLYEERMPAKH